ncbi:unnamed protein product, partial [Didymodactylos carnosus]
EITDEEFNILRQYLMESAYGEKEVYNTTTPAEFKRFQSFLNGSNFTTVVDGLNVLYGVGRFGTDSSNVMDKTTKILKKMNINPKNMLFIARKHVMKRLTPDVQLALKSMCQLFLVDDTSRDDWFILYAAFYSKAQIVTSDILRKERGFFNGAAGKTSKINLLFQKWLYRYQYLWVKVGYKAPMAHKLRAQYRDDVWLIPYFDQPPVSVGERPEQWFYVYKKDEQKTKLLKQTSSNFRSSAPVAQKTRRNILIVDE